MAVLVELLTIPEAFVLHGLLQLTANGYRAWLNRAYILWGPTAYFLIGVAAILIALALFSFTPDRALVLIALGLVPFVASAVKNHWQKNHPTAFRLDCWRRCGWDESGCRCCGAVAGYFLSAKWVKSQASGCNQSRIGGFRPLGKGWLFSLAIKVDSCRYAALH